MVRLTNSAYPSSLLLSRSDNDDYGVWTLSDLGNGLWAHSSKNWHYDAQQSNTSSLQEKDISYQLRLVLLALDDGGTITHLFQELVAVVIRVKNQSFFLWNNVLDTQVTCDYVTL